MAAWSEFVDKNSSQKFIEKLNWITQNQVTELASVWYDAGRYFLAQRKIVELKELQGIVENEILVLEEDLAEAQKEQENSTKSRLDSDFIRTSKNQIRLMHHVESEIASTISYLSIIPRYAVPDWFVEFLKAAVSKSRKVDIISTDDWSPGIKLTKEAMKKRRSARDRY
jgi:hypothetical protein